MEEIINDISDHVGSNWTIRENTLSTKPYSEPDLYCPICNTYLVSLGGVWSCPKCGKWFEEWMILKNV